jgi:2-dehydro-3-deoxyphosphogalactonate aldolase
MSVLATSVPAGGTGEAREANVARWRAALAECPLVAILRGLRPEEAREIGLALYDAGLRVLEVPLNGPGALLAIRALSEAFAGRGVAIGAGTVVRVEDVRRVAEHGGTLIVSPNVDTDVVRASVAAGLVSVPGVATPSEAFAALRAGADALKAFPGEQLPPKVIKAWRGVLPAGTCLLPVGGIVPGNVAEYLAAGASGFGVGSSVWLPGDSPAQCRARASSIIEALRAARAAAVAKAHRPTASEAGDRAVAPDE